MGTGYTSFPVAQVTTVPNNYFFIRDPADTTNEMVQVTVGGGGTSGWTVTRGALGTLPVAHAAGATWIQAVSSGTLENFKQASNANVSAVTVANTSSPTVLATYVPGSFELNPGASFEIIAYGTIGWTAKPTLTLSLYWGGSGSVGGTYTPGTLLAMIKTGTNTPTLTPTTATATSTGFSWDLNATLTVLSSTTVTANMNMWYNGTSLVTTAVNATTVNTNSSGLSGSSPVTVSGNGPIYLVATWSSPSAVNSLIATAPLIVRES